MLLASADTGDTTETYPLATTAGAFPVTPSDEFTVSDVTVADRPLTEGDILRIVWRGSEEPLPVYCLNSRDDTTLETTLAKYVVE